MMDVPLPTVILTLLGAEVAVVVAIYVIRRRARTRRWLDGREEPGSSHLPTRLSFLTIEAMVLGPFVGFAALVVPLVLSFVACGTILRCR